VKVDSVRVRLKSHYLLIFNRSITPEYLPSGTKPHHLNYIPPLLPSEIGKRFTWWWGPCICFASFWPFSCSFHLQYASEPFYSFPSRCLFVYFCPINVMMALPIIPDGASACIHGGHFPALFSILFAACLIWAFFFADDHFGSFWTKWWGSSCNFLLLSPLMMIVGCPDVLDNPGLRLVLIILVLGWSW